LPYGGIGVLVSLDKLRPRNERKKTPSSYHLFDASPSVHETHEERRVHVYKEYLAGLLDDFDLREFKKERPTRKEFERRLRIGQPPRREELSRRRLGSTGSLTKSRARSTNEFQTAAEDDLTIRHFRPVLKEKDFPKVEKKRSERLAALAKESRTREETDILLGKSEKRLVELKTSLAAEQQDHEETKRLLEEGNQKSSELEAILGSTHQVLEEKERDIISSEQISDEFESELIIEQQLHEELKMRCQSCELKSNELERKLAFEQKTRKDTENRLQVVQQTSKELETTVATLQKVLKNNRQSDKRCDWMLKRAEIHMTEEKLGSGAFGTVYKGMFRGTQVAVKQVSKHAGITEYNKENFIREMRMASRCRHPHMLQFIGATSDDESPLLVTELLDTSLRQVLHDCALEPTENTTIALDVAKGLNYLHLNRPNPIVHRDISSGNVLLWKHGDSWRGKVSDYGNAVLMKYAKTGSGGAIPYLAPEMENQKCSTKVGLLQLSNGTDSFLFTT
jgi:hypothetical protein